MPPLWPLSWATLVKAAFAVVQEHVRSAADGVNDQVQIAVAVNVGKNGAGVKIGQATPAVGDVFQLRVAQITIERIGPSMLQK